MNCFFYRFWIQLQCRKDGSVFFLGSFSTINFMVSLDFGNILCHRLDFFRWRKRWKRGTLWLGGFVFYLSTASLTVNENLMKNFRKVFCCLSLLFYILKLKRLWTGYLQVSSPHLHSALLHLNLGKYVSWALIYVPVPNRHSFKLNMWSDS